MAERRYYTVTFAVDLDDETDKAELEKDIRELLERQCVENEDIRSSLKP